MRSIWASQVKNLPANARDVGLIPGSGRPPGGGPGNPLQSSCLEHPMDRAAWRAAVLGVAESRTRLKRLSTHDVPLEREERPESAMTGVLIKRGHSGGFPWR